MKRYRWKSATGCLATVLIGANAATAQSPNGTPQAPKSLGAPVVPIPVELPKVPGGDLKLVKQPIDEPPPTPQPAAPAAPAPAPAPAPAAPAAPAAGGSSSTVNVSGSDPSGAAAPTAGGGQPTQALNATDLGGLLGKSDQATGVEVQRRNAISSDPRIRGLRNGQYLALGDGVPYFPGRLDLDTPVSKFYPAMVRDVQVFRGPFTTLLGPGFGFINIGTVNAPRSKNGGTEYHGISSLGYQTNGEQYNALQVVSAAGTNWGFRGSYNILQGNDYADGGGNKIPASYLSNNFNVALGYDLSEDVTVDFKGLRTFQSNLEFPGLYFDVDASDTEAYNTRITARNFGPFDVFTTDLWYNVSTTSGSTRGGAKKAFVNQLLRFAFEEPFLPRNPAGVPQLATNGVSNLRGFSFADDSSTRFAERSIGYRFNGQWGNNKDELTLFMGTDLNVFGQHLTENIRFEQLRRPDGSYFGTPIATADNPNPSLLPPGQRNFITQTQEIPKSNSVNPGLFLEGMLPLNDKLKLKGGGRIDYVRTSSNARRITGNVDLFGDPQNPQPVQNRFVLDPIIYSVDPTQNNMNRDFMLYAGFATAEYKISEETTLFAGYGYAERAPNLTELYTSGPFLGVLQTGTSRVIGDPNLSKERMHHIDIGLRYDTDYLKFGISGFYAMIQDYITYDANRVSQLGLSQVTFTNTDLATLAGTELFMQANVTKWFSPFATLSYVQGIDQTHVDNRRGSIQANGSRLDSSRRRDPSTGSAATDTEPLPNIPPMETRLGFRIHGSDPVPKWQIEVVSRIVSGQNAIARSLGEIATPGFSTIDLRGYYQLNENLLLTGGVENLGDRLYREHLDPIAANQLRSLTGEGSIPVLFRPGTNFFFNVQYKY
ncbi:MAG: TonB-dependent receptor [Gemmataceae bacterium]|nr:TonB-dependent receptor [Planctomycetia bacterium]MBX3400136.1 TonB-dependent receptor [Gemmataceae bacterium]